MALFAAPSSNRGDITLQPSYFTSSIFVAALRNDITTLILHFWEEYTHSLASSQPFPLFKKIWTSQGWHWLHFKAFDNRTRWKFLDVTSRLFLEKTVTMEAPFTRVSALFGLYTFFFTQPKNTEPALCSLKYLPITKDHYNDLKTMPDTLSAPDLLRFQPTVISLLATFIDQETFLVIPGSDLSPSNPRELPREFYMDEETPFSLESTLMKKKGRPSKRDKSKKAKMAAECMDKWLNKTAYMALGSDDETMSVCSDIAQLASLNPTDASLDDYQLHKSRLLMIIDPAVDQTSEGRAAIEHSGRLVVERLREVRELLSRGVGSRSDTNVSGLQRVENTLENSITGIGLNRCGVLGLLEGVGLR